MRRCFVMYGGFPWITLIWVCLKMLKLVRGRIDGYRSDSDYLIASVFGITLLNRCRTLEEKFK